MFGFWLVRGNLPGLSEVPGEQWLRIMQKHPRVRLVDLICLLSVSGMHCGYSLSVCSSICCMWEAWSLGIALNGGKSSSWPGAIESRVVTGRKL